MKFSESLRTEERSGWTLKCPFCGNDILFVYHMTRLGAGPGATLVFPELLGSVIFVIIFFRQFDEPLGA